MLNLGFLCTPGRAQGPGCPEREQGTRHSSAGAHPSHPAKPAYGPSPSCICSTQFSYLCMLHLQDPTVLQGAQMPTQFSAPFMMVPSMGMAPAGFQMAPAGQAPVQYFLQPMAAAPQPQQIMLVPGPMMQPVPQPQTLVSLKPAIPPSPFECAPSASTTLTTIPQGAFTFDVSGAQQAVPVQMQQFTPVTFEPAANGPAGSSGNKQNSEGSRQGRAPCLRTRDSLSRLITQART